MNYGSIQLPNTISEIVLEYSGWGHGFELFTLLVGRHYLFSSANNKTWWFTGGIRTNFMGRLSITADGTTTSTMRLSNSLDLLQRRIYRLYSRCRAQYVQDPLGSEIIRQYNDEKIRFQSGLRRLDAWQRSLVNPNPYTPEEAQRLFTRQTLDVCRRQTRTHYAYIQLNTYEHCPIDSESGSISNDFRSRGKANGHLLSTGELHTPLSWQFSLKPSGFTTAIQSQLGIAHSTRYYSRFPDFYAGEHEYDGKFINAYFKLPRGPFGNAEFSHVVYDNMLENPWDNVYI